MTPRRGSTARTGPPGSAATKSPVAGIAEARRSRPESGARQRADARVDDHAAAVDGDDARGDERRVAERVEIGLQLRAPAEAREGM